MTTVSEVMTHGIRTVTPQDQATLAAQLMDRMGVGSLPVCDVGRLVGMVTDRDLVVRGLAKQASLEGAQVQELMSNDVIFCFENQSVDEVLKCMSENQLRRIPVLNAEKKLVGIITLGDIVTKERPPRTDDTLAAISLDIPK